MKLCFLPNSTLLISVKLKISSPHARQPVKGRVYFARPSLWQPSTWWNSEQSTIEALCLADVIRPFDVSNKFLIRRNSVWIKQHYLR